MANGKLYTGLIISGLISGALYFALLLYHEEIMEVYTRTDGWYPALPIVTAFAFSFAHGAFAGYFWEVVGIAGRTEG